MKRPYGVLLVLWAAAGGWLWAAASGCASGASPSSGAGGEGGGSASGAGNDGEVPKACTASSQCSGLDDDCGKGACQNQKCVKQPSNENGACDDGKYCTDDTTCKNGVCGGGTKKHCESADPCNAGACDDATQACKPVPANDGAGCDDEDPCTNAGVCNGGICDKGTPLDCSHLDTQCTVGVCDQAEGCIAAPKAGPCDDLLNSPCTQGECANGACVSHPANDGASCDDDLYCTIGDTCSNGTCVGQPNTCTNGNTCVVGSCDEATKACTTAPTNEGGACSDGDPCTVGETCGNGTCAGGQPAPNGTACDDKNSCTTGETCSGGLCGGGQSTNDNLPCDDGNGCTSGTTCNNGVCGDPTSEVTQCFNGDSCCPAGCPTDNDCFYWASGVQQNVPLTHLVGWTLCHSGAYDETAPSLTTILQHCDKSKLLLACRGSGAPTLSLVAMAPRHDVLFDCGSTATCTKQSNGVGWYYSTDYSWGFAPGGLAVNRNTCDGNDVTAPELFPELRMCWRTSGGSLDNGFRCGDNELDFAWYWERLVYEAD
jgi:hypothetical protein